jgi:hypothetical protein
LFLARISKYLPFEPGLFTATLVLVFLCWNPSRRDPLVGYGRILSLISLAALLIWLSMTFLGSSLFGSNALPALSHFFAVDPVLGETAALTSAPEFKWSMARAFGEF